MNPETSETSFRGRIAALQSALRSAGVQAILVPAGDPHLSEYPCAHWEGRRWLTGFTGSRANLVVFEDSAALLPEALYWEQAETQLAGTGVEVIRHPAGSHAGTLDWLPRQLRRGAQIAVNGHALALAAARQLTAALASAGMTLRPDLDLLSTVWTDRPTTPRAPVFEHHMSFAAAPRTDKLARLRDAMESLGATHHLVSTLEDVAWLTNLRGDDSPNTPVFLSHLLVDTKRAQLFVDAGKLDEPLVSKVFEDGIDVRDYADLQSALKACSTGDRLLLDPNQTTVASSLAIGDGCQVVEAINPSALFKSRKSDGEAANIRETMAEDGAAMCEFYARFESDLAGSGISERSIDERLTGERRRRRSFVKPSFPTIAAFNAHGALPHYVATSDTDVAIEGHGLLLIDSGGQFLGGTTDITRMWPIGDVTPAMKRDVTMVLKAHVAMATLRFPRGTLSTMLDAVARVPMWQEGMDYAHGTGHGVGYCLGVHEGPQTFRQAIPDPAMAMEPGMVMSIEPAIYRPGQWGVRIENLVLVVPAQVTEGNTFGEFLEFETLSLCPIDTRSLERDLLQDHEVRWLNRYHDMVRERLSPKLSGAALDWLLARTQPI